MKINEKAERVNVHVQCLNVPQGRVFVYSIVYSAT